MIDYRKTQLSDYPTIIGEIGKLPEDEKKTIMRRLCLTDLYFLLRYVCERKDVERQWTFDRIREVQGSPNDHLDLWAREHWKSSIITFALTIFDILRTHAKEDFLENSETCICIFSHSRPIAKAFLRQIMRELESNDLLKVLFPDVLYLDPKKDSPKWSEDDGIVVKRRSNPPVSTVEAWGLVDGQPVSKHFPILIYDDVVTMKSVTTGEMIRKTTEAVELSYNLGTDGGAKRFVGTIYDDLDTWSVIRKRKTAHPRIYPCTDNGEATGNPVVMTREYLDSKLRDMGPFTFCHAAGTQILMADFTEKPIEEVKTGDEVIGLDFNRKTRLCKTKVIAPSIRLSETNTYTFESGRETTCTPDHKWWTGRNSKNDHHRKYAPLGLDYHDLKKLCSVVKPVEPHKDIWAAAYMSGMYDGEGSYSGNTIHISQSQKIHPEVCDKIRDALDRLGFDYGEHIAPSKDDVVDFYIRGGRQEQYRFLTQLDPAKRNQIANGLIKSGAMNLGYKGPNLDRLVGIRQAGYQSVFNIQTETGNYVANGFVTKNSTQMLLNPVPAEDAFFTHKDFIIEQEAPDLNLYICSDFAVQTAADGGKDWTEHGVFGVDSYGNPWVIDWWSGQVSSDIWIDAALDLVRDYPAFHWVGESGQIRRSVEPFLNKRMAERALDRTSRYISMQWLPSIGNKPMRMQNFHGLVKQRGLRLLSSPWNVDLINEMVRFPKSQKDHKADACSLFGRALGQTWALALPDEQNSIEIIRDYGAGRPSLTSWKCV